MKNIETQQKEFKKSLSELKQGIVSLVAMLNKHGEAELWFGISPNGEAVGLDVAEKTLRNLSQAIAAHVEPAIYPTITKQIIDGKSCIKLEALGLQKPYFAYGRAYMRVANEDKRLSVQELKQLVLREACEAVRWETEPSQLSIAQLNPEKIARFLSRAGLADGTPENALDKLEMIQNGRLVRAANLFFADEPIELRCAVFAGKDTGGMVIDMKDYHGDMLELIEEAERYILKNIHIGMRLEGLYRVDVPEIAPEALREAIINAFCHRDWRDPENVRVAVFKDRVEISSPGELYGNLTIERIMQGNVSRRRNPLIATMLRRIHLVEALGRGMPKILSNAPNATFKQEVGLFVSVFERATLEGDANSAHEQVTEQVTEQVMALLLVIGDKKLGTKQLMSGLELKHRPTFLKNYLKPSLQGSWVEMTQPESPRSPTQKYRLTSQGKKLLQDESPRNH